MRYERYNPQLSAYSGDSRRRRRRILGCLRGFIAIMTVMIVAVAFVLFWQLFFAGEQSHENGLFTKKTSVTSASVSTIPLATATPTPTPMPEITELLPYSEIIENYFGPLPVPEFRTPLVRKEVHGIYIAAGENITANIELANNSEINAFVLDLKEGYGVGFNSTNPIALETGQVKSLYNLSSVVEKCHENDIWVIGRIVCFKDWGLLNTYPHYYIKDENGNTLKFENEKNSSFLSPYNTNTWDYFIDLAIEAVEMGVDEIQFDYVRFPAGATTTGEKPYFGPPETTPTKAEAINRFLQTARIRIQDTYGVPVGADIFAIVMTNQPDRLIVGQDWPTVGLTGVDNLCPMIYPDHYGREFYLNGRLYSPPKDYPYEIVYNSLLVAGQQAAQGFSVVRPYLAAYTYGYDDINRQIKGAQDAGSPEFILWNVFGNYPDGQYDGG
ncbi:MAG: hypothetical protein GXY43_02165 [Clostridiaceae bacterium]|nr:hypothetical protein [Clostridiaceae bacterium]